MKFLRVEITNLFSYRRGVFDFPENTDPKRNVILIHGRNGYGKTSFINALKLFFVGYDDPEIRVTLKGRSYSAKEYIVGGGAEWEGAFNRQAIAAGERVCSISIKWSEQQGIVNATRSWTIDVSGDVIEELNIIPSFKVDEGTLDDIEQQQDFIERRLPRSLLPFFVYDAEQVQRIAESQSEVMIEQVERLLDITTLNTAELFVNRVLAKLRKESDAKAEQIKLERLRGEYEIAKASKAKIVNDIENAEIEDSDYQRRVVEIRSRLMTSRAATNQQSESIIKDQIKSKKDALDEKSGNFLESFPAIAPLVSHPHLVGRALERLRLATQGRAQLVDELKQILGRLPDRLFDEPPVSKPPLTDIQSRFYKQKVALLIETEISLASATTDEGVWGVDTEVARRTEAQLRDYSSAPLREAFSVQLKEISKLMRDEIALEVQLKDLSNVPADERDRQAARLAELDRLEQLSRNLRQEIGSMHSNLIPVNRDIERLRGEVNFQERRVSEATRNQTSVQIADKAAAGIRIYRSALKQSRRQSIEDAMNEHVRDLMDSSTQIGSVKFDEHFRMTYFDVDGKPVGMGNISAGMKQITAQAFLWALKDVARTSFPVVIDTPLARIDSGHQKLLIRNFYPKAAEQVIVLPTDSELDHHKYELLKPFIAAEFKLSNPKGDSTEVAKDVQMYEVAVE